MPGPWEKYAKPAAGAGVPIGQQDPFRLPQAQADLAGKQVQTASTAQGMEVERQRLALEQSRVGLDQSRAGLDTTKAQMEISAARRAQDEKERERRLAFAPMESLNAQMRRAWDTYAAGPGSTKPDTLGALADFIPRTPANAKFDTVAAGLGQQGLSAFRVPGAGAQSDAELKAFVDANQPAASNLDATIEEKLANIERRMAPIYAANGKTFTPYRPKGVIGGGGPPKPAAAPATSKPVRIMGDGDYNRLPAGAMYVGPDGVTRVK